MLAFLAAAVTMPIVSLSALIMACFLVISYSFLSSASLISVVIACLISCFTFSPLYIPAFVSSILEKGRIGTVRRFLYFGSIKYMYLSIYPGIYLPPPIRIHSDNGLGLHSTLSALLNLLATTPFGCEVSVGPATLSPVIGKYIIALLGLIPVKRKLLALYIVPSPH